MIFLFFIVVNVTVLKKNTDVESQLVSTSLLSYLLWNWLENYWNKRHQFWHRTNVALSILPSRTFYSGVVDWPVILDVCSLVNITHSPEMNSLTFLSASAYKLHHIKCFNVSQLRTTLQLVDRPKRIPDTMQSCTYQYIWSLFSLVFI